MLKTEDIKAMLRVAIIGLLEYGYSAEDIHALTKRILAKSHQISQHSAVEHVQDDGLVKRIHIKKGIIYDPIRQCILYNDSLISLSPTDSKLLHAFLMNQGSVLNYQDIVRSVKEKPDTTDYDMTTRNWIHSLRSKLEEIPGAESWISNVRGVGYYFSVK